MNFGSTDFTPEQRKPLHNICAYDPRQPALYVEFWKSDKAALHREITALGYAVHENGMNFHCKEIAFAPAVPEAVRTGTSVGE